MDKANIHAFVFDAVTEPLFVLDEHFCFTAANNALCQLFSTSAADLVTKPLVSLLSEKHEKRFLKNSLAAFSVSNKQQLEVWLGREKRHKEHEHQCLIKLSKFMHDNRSHYACILVTPTSLSRELYQAKTSLSSLIDHSFTGILITDTEGHVLHSNTAAEVLLNVPKSDLIGTPFGNVVSHEYTQRVEIDILRKGKQSGRAEVLTTEIEWMAEPARLVLIHDISDLVEARNKVEKLAYFDQLTQLPNRRFVISALEKATHRYQRRGDGFAVLFIDINSFKEINDSLGHIAGDLVLQCVAMRLQHCVRQEDLVGRYGGDEFICLIEQVADSQQAIRILKSIEKEMKKPMVVCGKELRSAVSIGVSLYPKDDLTVDGLISKADAAMYASKKPGAPTYTLFDVSILVVVFKNLCHSYS